MSYLFLFLYFFLQRHPAGLSSGTAQELRGHAGADAGREGLPGDWVPAGEGMFGRISLAFHEM